MIQLVNGQGVLLPYSTLHLCEHAPQITPLSSLIHIPIW